MAYDDRHDENTSRALAEIRRVIDGVAVDGRLPTEREFSERLGVGRRTVRRALEALEAEGLIWRRQGKGTFIGQPPDPTAAMAAELAGAADLLSVMEARIALEPALAELAARRATADDVQRLRHLAERTGAAGDADAAELWDGSLHRLIARIAGNRLLMAAFGLLDEVRMGDEWRRRRNRARSEATRALYDRQHRAIVDAIAARDGGAARAAMGAHLSTLRDYLARALEEAT